MSTDIETVIGKVKDGIMSPEEGNVEMVRLRGYVLVRGGLPREVRANYMRAVKAGKLGRIKKDGIKPEAFYNNNISARALALEARNREVYRAIEALRKVCV